jgi:hypothetical protein
MKQSRRNFGTTSIAFGIATVTKVGAQPFLFTPATWKIGFLVSTKDKAKHDAAFKQVFTDNGFSIDFKPLSGQDDYDTTDFTLKQLANQHIAGKVDLIVAAGGLPTADAVASAVQAEINKPGTPPPFVFLIGRYPQLDPTSGNPDSAPNLYKCVKTYTVTVNGVPTIKMANAGGVDMAMVDQNQSNYDQLNQSPRNVPISAVGLIVNKNNWITSPEVTDWTDNVTDPTYGGNPNSNYIYYITDPNTDAHAISNMLSKIKAGISTAAQPTGIVVSSDAFLREAGDSLKFDDQLRDSNGGNFKGWVCYPFQDYIVSGQSFVSTTTPYLATDTPTDQKAAYYQLGKAALNVLNTNTNAGLTTWENSAWKNAPMP